MNRPFPDVNRSSMILQERAFVARLPCLLLVVAASLAGSATADVEFGRDVQPILADHCYACHGPDAATRKAGLRLDRPAADSGFAAITPGDAGESELIARVTAVDLDVRMPPPEHGDRLSDEEIELLRRWIDEGARHDVHWAYVAPSRPTPPEVNDESWVGEEIDRFVLSRLEREGVAPASTADPRTLIRRLSFDLTGLAPSPSEVDAFVSDPSQDAWSALVEDRLASVAHAERMTTFWFDLVRYADTTGIHADNRWNAWPYRDWVIDAFRRNMPFDRFTREQLAGDLLPDATRSQRVAATYNRLNLITREGGSQPKEFLIRYTADRARNAAEVWMATTIGCAECHDHKFDPITTREFYEFGAFFADIEQVGVYEEAKENHFEPEMQVPTPAQESERDALLEGIAAAQREMMATSEALLADRAEWERVELERESAWRSTRPSTAAADSGVRLDALDDGSLLATGDRPDRDRYVVTFELSDDGAPVDVTAVRIELLQHESLPSRGPGRAGNGNLVITELEVALDGVPLVIAGASATPGQEGYPVAAAVDGAAGPGGWALLSPTGVGSAFGVFPLRDQGRGARLTVTMHQDHGTGHTVGRFRVSTTDRADPPTSGVLPPELVAALAVDPTERSPANAARLDMVHRATTPLLADARAEHARLTERRNRLEEEIPVVLETRATTPMVVRVRPRGNWMDDTGDVVEPNTPAVFGRLDTGGRRATRLDLADWLVSGDHPVAARVLVNRVWRMLFGRGLVVTLDDFGTQGAPPTHAALLDHLACELVESGWDVRYVIRRIVRSNAYRQASGSAPEARAGDPSNELLARQGRFRIDAEFIRDNALAAGDRLSRRVGGPSVYPYQPPGYWAHLNFPEREYEPSTGDDLRRRSVYAHWQRQYLHPAFLAFDAPSRDRCTAERMRSNTPLQALALLNDPIVVEAARSLAELALHSEAGGDETRIRLAWRRVLQREPREEETSAMRELLEAHRGHYRRHPDMAERLIGTGETPADPRFDPSELAAWTSVARVLLNLHETITRS